MRNCLISLATAAVILLLPRFGAAALSTSHTLVAGGKSVPSPAVHSAPSPATTSTLAGTDRTTQTLSPSAPKYPFLKHFTRYPWKRLPGDIWIRDVYIGKGRKPSKGVAVYMNYVGYLEDGRVFVDTKKSRQWLDFTFGDRGVLESLQEGIATMREGGVRWVVIPPGLAYGKEGYQPPGEGAVDIPPNATVIFKITLLWIRKPEFNKLHIFK